MHRKNLVAAAALALVAFAPATARAQEKLPFDTIVRSPFGGAARAEQRVIWSVEEYRALFHGAPPASPAVRWGEEVVLAVSLGARATSGHSIEVTRILRGASVALSHHAFVEYVERAPKPTDIVASVVTQPLHVVKVKTGWIWQFVFTHDASLARGHDEISLTVVDGAARTQISVARDGRAVATVREASGQVSSAEGPLDSFERWHLDHGFAENDLFGLPDSIAGSTAHGSVVLTVRSGSRAKTFRAPLGVYRDAKNDVTDRVLSFVDNLRRTAERIAPSHVARVTVRGRLGPIYYIEDSLAVYLEGGAYGALEIRDQRFLPLLERARREGRFGSGPLVLRGRAVSKYSIPNAYVENSGTIEPEWVEGRFANQLVRVVGESSDGRWTAVVLGGVRFWVPSASVKLAA